jgi:hypothetical protein
VHLNSIIWDTIASSKDHSFRLSALSSEQADQSDTDHTLAILALLSSPSIQMLRLNFQSDQGRGTTLDPREFTRKLTDWWRKKEIKDEDWERWAKSILVSWVPAHDDRRNP